jgi:hypothetical protein
MQTLLRIHFMQQWFKLSDPAMEEALHDVPAFRDLPTCPIGMSTSPANQASCAFAICWSATSWPNRFWLRSMRCCRPKGCS